MRAVRALAAVLLALLVGVAVALPPSDAADDPGELRERVERAKERERSLAGSVERLREIERGLERQAARLEERLAVVQADLDRDEAALERVRADLRRERARALRLRERLAEARELLARRLLERYKAPEVDLLSVVLNATSFANLLERATFLRRIQDNDEEIVVAVRHARADAIRERRRLDAAEERRRRIVAALRARRDALAAIRSGVEARRAAAARVHEQRLAALGAARADRDRLQRALREAEREAERAAQRAATQGSPGAGSGLGPGAGWAIPWPIVLCESGGQNLPPNSAGASGYYQIMPATWKGLGGKGPHAYLRPKAEQDAAAAKLWAGGAGAHNWVCADIVG